MSEASVYRLGEKRLAALDHVDGLPPGLRQCVHEYGHPIVSVLLRNGVTDPLAVHQIVREIWLGARQAGQAGGALESVNSILGHDAKSFPWLQRFLALNNYVVAPLTPTRAMLEASMSEVSGHNVRCTREQKHQRRITAALKTCRPSV